MQTKILIPMFDSRGQYMKQLESRYAVQRVLKGRSKWIRNNTAIQEIESCPVLSVFSEVGATFPVADAMKKLMALFPNDPCARHKAAGALGGASRHGFLSLDNKGVWSRIR